MKKKFLIIALIFILGCAQAKNFDYGLKQINSLNSKYNATMEIYPKTMQKISLMIDDLKELRKLQLETGKESFDYIVDYRILNLEAERLYREGQKYGNSGTTKEGFGCKSRPLIIESVSLRNISALKGFEAVELLREFVDKHPEEAAKSNLSRKNALFLNATFYQIYKDARSDSSIINHFCPQNETLALYKEEFRKKTNLSEDFISNLRYEEAVPIWKKLRGIA